MTEQLMRRKFYLRRYQTAPLYQEREAYLKQLADAGYCKQSLLLAAKCMLFLVRNVPMKDGETNQVPIACIVKCASRMKDRYNNPSTTSRQGIFISIAVRWLRSMNRLDQSVFGRNVITDIFTRSIYRIRYLCAPFLKERMSYLEELRKRGVRRYTLRQIARMQFNIVQHLRSKSIEKITKGEIVSAVREWHSEHNIKTPKSEAVRACVAFANRWLSWLGAPIEVKGKSADSQSSAYALWRGRFKHLSPCTIRRDRDEVSNLIAFLSKHGKTLADSTPRDVDDYISMRRDRDGLCRASIRLVVTILRGFFSFAASKGWCDTVLTKSLKAPRTYAQENIPCYAPWDAVRRIVENASLNNSPAGIRNAAILSLLAIYGLRSSEVRNLTIDDFDWCAETLRIRRAKNCREQTYPLNRFVGDAVIRYIKEVRPREFKSRSLFATLKAPYRPVTSCAVYAIASNALKSEKVAVRHHGPHCMRHSCATRLINNGISLKEVSDMLGHNRMDSTAIYAKVDLNSLRDVSNFDFGGLL